MNLANVQTRSFFKRFKERLHQEGNKDPGGRYFSVLLEQVFHEAPELLAKLLFPRCNAKQFRHARVYTDFPYIAGRLADLAFLDSEDRTIGLVEVKEEDQLQPGTGHQTRDYLSYIRKQHTRKAPVHFAYVTKAFDCSLSSLHACRAHLKAATRAGGGGHCYKLRH